MSGCSGTVDTFLFPYKAFQFPYWAFDILQDEGPLCPRSPRASNSRAATSIPFSSPLIQAQLSSLRGEIM